MRISSDIAASEKAQARDWHRDAVSTATHVMVTEFMAAPGKVRYLDEVRAGSPLPRLLAEFSTEPMPGDGSDGALRWTRLRILQTREYEYCCEKVRGPEPLVSQTAVVTSLDDARRFFGGGWVVKELFSALDPQRFPRWPQQ